MQKLVLIDGNAIIHRAFHALPPLTNKEGQLTNAVYGFFSMFLKILEDTKPDCVVVCFDRPKPTFRQALYVEYQAQRPEMDEGLVPQVGMVHEVLDRAKIKIFEMDGYEADDLIGTLAFQAVSNAEKRRTETQNNAEITSDGGKKSLLPGGRMDSWDGGTEVEVIIVSGDRDLLQLVNHRVKMLAPITGITKMVLYDEKLVEEKFVIKPKQIVDYKALVGDASDNYPGVAGVGPKTAVSLLRDYQTLEGIYQNVNQIKKKNEGLFQKLKDGEESAEMAKKLATIVVNAPVALNLDECSGDFDKEEIKKAFEELGFKSLIKRLEGEESDNDQSKEIKKEDKKKTEKKEGEQLGLL